MYDGRHKLSVKYIPLTIFRTIRRFVYLIIVLIISIYSVLRDHLTQINIPLSLIIIGVVLFFVIICTVTAIVQYKRFRWELSDEEVHIYKGLISRKQLHVPYKRIHSVDINARLLDRILGVVTIKMDTAGGSANAADVQIPALEISVAAALKNEVFRRKAMAQGDVMPADAVSNIAANLNTVSDQFSEQVGMYFDKAMPLGTVTATNDGAVYKLSAGELILSGISSGSSILVILIALGGLIQLVGTLGEYSEKIWSFIGSAAADVYAQGVLAVIAILFVIILISTAISVISKLITLWGFTVSCNGDNIEVHRGLLERNAASIAVKRVQAVKIRQGIIKRILGYCEISVERVSAKIETDRNTQAKLNADVLHPFIKKSKVPEFLSAILPEYADVPGEDTLIRMGGSALRRSFLRFGYCTLILIELPLFVAWYLIGKYGIPDVSGTATIQSVLILLAIAIFIFQIIRAFFVWRGRAVGHDDKMLVMREGAFGRTLVFMPRRKIQYAVKSQNPFQRHANLATITAHNAAISKVISMIDVTDNCADDYLEWVERHTSEVLKRKI